MATAGLLPDEREMVVAHVGGLGVPTATGRFGAMMEVELVNDGPVTFVLEEAP